MNKEIENIIACFGAIALSAFMIINAGILIVDEIPELSIFNRKIISKKSFRIQREMSGEHRKPYGLFLMSTAVGLTILFIGLPFKALVIMKSAGVVLGITWIFYGLYGIYKKEIVAGWSSDRSYGVAARCFALFYFVIGSIILVTL